MPAFIAQISKFCYTEVTPHGLPLRDVPESKGIIWESTNNVMETNISSVKKIQNKTREIDKTYSTRMWKYI